MHAIRWGLPRLAIIVEQHHVRVVVGCCVLRVAPYIVRAIALRSGDGTAAARYLFAITSFGVPEHRLWRKGICFEGDIRRVAGPAAGNSRRADCHRRCNSAARREATEQLATAGPVCLGRWNSRERDL